MDLFGTKKRRAVWTQAAKELGGEHKLNSRWWRNDERITATVNGVPILLDVYIVSTGKTTQAYTRVRAPYQHGPGPKLSTHKHGFFASLGNALGMNDVAVGDPDFDKRMVVRTKHAAIARRIWSSPSARALMLGYLEDDHLTSEPDEVQITGGGRWKHVQQIKDAFGLLGELASCDIYGSNALRAVAGASYSQPEGDRPRAELDTGVRVVIQAEDRDTLVMGARAVERLEVEPAVIEIEDGKHASTALSQAAMVHARNVGSGTLTINPAWLSFVWRDLEQDPVRLRAGADLLGAIANAVRGGVYR